MRTYEARGRLRRLQDPSLGAEAGPHELVRARALLVRETFSARVSLKDCAHALKGFGSSSSPEKLSLGWRRSVWYQTALRGQTLASCPVGCELVSAFSAQLSIYLSIYLWGFSSEF